MQFREEDSKGAVKTQLQLRVCGAELADGNSNIFKFLEGGGGGGAVVVSDFLPNGGGKENGAQAIS